MIPSPSREMYKKIESLLFRFIAGSEVEKIKRKTLIGPYCKGGFKMIDLYCQNAAIKMSWMNRLLNVPGTWKDFIIEQHIDHRYLLSSNILFCDLPFKFDKSNI